MAVKKVVELEPREVVIMSSALTSYKEVIRRQMNKEPVGSEVREVFEKRLSFVGQLLDKVTGQGSVT